VALNTFGTATAQKEFERQFDEIAKSSALTFDVRENGGGNSGYGTAILSHLIEKPTASEEWRSREYVPAQRAWGNPPGWTGGKPMTQPSKDQHYGNPVVMLTSPRTGSAAEDFTIDFELMGCRKIIGEPTGGGTGQPLFSHCPEAVRRGFAPSRIRIPMAGSLSAWAFSRRSWFGPLWRISVPAATRFWRRHWNTCEAR
jgi:carboxyl-terminal processing protease